MSSSETPAAFGIPEIKEAIPKTSESKRDPEEVPKVPQKDSLSLGLIVGGICMAAFGVFRSQ